MITSTTQITTIVVTRNNPCELRGTLASIAEQCSVREYVRDFRVEVIIVDGSDECRSEAWARSILGQHVALRIIHEYPPRGVYSAMNIALASSQGDIVHFLNAGDFWYDRNSLFALVDAWRSSDSLTIAFGQSLICPAFSSFSRPWLVPDPAVQSIRRWLRYYVPNHQSVFVEGNWARAHPFSLHSPHAADREWIYSAMSNWSRVLYLPRPLVRYNLGGISSRLPDWNTLQLRLREPGRSRCQKFAEILKFLLRPFEYFYPSLMAIRSRLVAFLV